MCQPLPCCLARPAPPRPHRALTIKASKLANIPCSSDPKVDNEFLLDNGNIVDTTTSRERNVGLTNRVIAGMLLHQVCKWAGPNTRASCLHGAARSHAYSPLCVFQGPVGAQPNRHARTRAAAVPTAPFADCAGPPAPCAPPQTRTNETICPESKFDKIQKTCTGPQTVASFGVDPVFKRGTSSYNADYDDVAGTKVGFGHTYSP